MTAGPQDVLELSVVAHDLRLDSNCGQDLIESVNRYAVRTTPVKFTPQTGRRATQSTRHNKISLDDPDELLLLTRAEELRKKRYWIIPLLGLCTLIARFAAPFTRLRRAHQASRSFLAPTGAFYYILIPVMSLETLYTLAALTPILRGTSIVHKGVSIGYLMSQIFNLIWIWSFSHPNGSMATAFSSSFISWACALAMLLSIKAERIESLAGVWQYRTRVKMNLRDYWLVEMPLTVYMMWTTAAFMITGNYYNVYDWLKFHPDGMYTAELTEVMIASALLSIIAFCLFVVAFFCYTRRGSPIVSAMGCWIIVDLAANFAMTPDVLSSPQLAWVDARSIGSAFHTGCAALGVIFGIAAVISGCIHCALFMSKAHTLNEETKSTFSFVNRSIPHYPASEASEWDRRDHKNGDIRSNDITVKRRPSEFLIRSLSSLTESNTPVRKK